MIIIKKKKMSGFGPPLKPPLGPRDLGAAAAAAAMLTVRPSRLVVVDHVHAGVQFLPHLVDAVALGKPAGQPGDHDVFGLEAELVGQHVGLDGRSAGGVRGHGYGCPENDDLRVARTEFGLPARLRRFAAVFRRTEIVLVYGYGYRVGNVVRASTRREY